MSRPGSESGRRTRQPRAGTEWLYGLNPVREALASQRRQLIRLRVRESPRGTDVEEIASQAARLGVSIEEVPSGRLAATVPDQINAQGVALLAGPIPESTLQELTTPDSEASTLIALDGVEDPQNLGAIARVAEAAGASGLILTKRRAPPLSAAVTRASAGAIEWLPVGRVGNLTRSLEDLKERGYWVFGTSPSAQFDLFELPDRVVAGKRVLVMGAEGRGIRPGIQRVLDHTVRIPMGGHVGSLNVSSAAAIVLFELKRRDRVANSADIPYK